MVWRGTKDFKGVGKLHLSPTSLIPDPAPEIDRHLRLHLLGYLEPPLWFAVVVSLLPRNALIRLNLDLLIGLGLIGCVGGEA